MKARRKSVPQQVVSRAIGDERRRSHSRGLGCEAGCIRQNDRDLRLLPLRGGRRKQSGCSEECDQPDQELEPGVDPQEEIRRLFRIGDRLGDVQTDDAEVQAEPDVGAEGVDSRQ